MSYATQVRSSNVSLRSHIGQNHVKPILEAEISAARRTGSTPRHILLSGPAGLGKTSLGRLLASESHLELVSFVADKSWNAAKVVKFLMSLPIDGYTKGGVRLQSGKRYAVFVDEVHLLPSYEPWYTVLEERECWTPDGKPNWLPELTFIGATTDTSKLPVPMLDRIPVQLRLKPYTLDELIMIIAEAYPAMPDSAVVATAERSKGVARVALNLAQSVINFGGVQVLDYLGIDAEGCDELDRCILDALYKADGPLSLNSLCARVGEPNKEVVQQAETYLIHIGKMQVTPQGRTLIQSNRGNRDKGGLGTI